MGPYQPKLDDINKDEVRTMAKVMIASHGLSTSRDVALAMIKKGGLMMELIQELSQDKEFLKSLADQRGSLLAFPAKVR